MMNTKNDFVLETMIRYAQTIQGLESSKSVLEGTMRWKIAGNQGVPHTFSIPNMQLVEAHPFRILSPQDWAQKIRKTMSGNDFGWTDHQKSTPSRCDGKYGRVTNISMVMSYPSQETKHNEVKANIQENAQEAS